YHAWDHDGPPDKPNQKVWTVVRHHLTIVIGSGEFCPAGRSGRVSGTPRPSKEKEGHRVRPKPRNQGFDEVGRSIDAQGTPAITECGAGSSRTARCRSLRALWIVLASLIVLWIVQSVVGLNPGFLAGDRDAGLPLDRCLTEQAVLQFLDGKAVLSLVSVDAAG